MIAREWAGDLFDFLLPAGCVSCRAWIPRREGGSLVCGPCRSRLKIPAWPRCVRCHHPVGTGRRGEAETEDCIECRGWPPELTHARYACRLSGSAADLVHALKYGGWAEVAHDMCDLMATVVGRHVTPAGGWPAAERPIVVPVPTTRRRERLRGYNQSLLLARELATRTDLRLCVALERPRETVSQTSLSPARRRENVRGAFAPVSRAVSAVRGADVLLVDDVLTTGATAGNAAIALSGMGAQHVTLVAFARATPPRPGT